MPVGARRANTRRPLANESVEESSGNVFQDLGVPDSIEALAKAELVARISELIEDRGLTQKQAGTLLGIDQSDVSNLIRGRLRGFSTERLFRFLGLLGQDVEIVIRPVRRKNALPSILVVRDGSRRTGAGAKKLAR